MRRWRGAVLAAAALVTFSACTDPSPEPPLDAQVEPCDVGLEAAPEFRPPEVMGEIHHHTEGYGGMLFESLESAVCDGFERVIVGYSRPPDHQPHEVGLWAEWVDEVTIEGTGAVVPIEGAEILQLSIVGATWQPGTGGTHTVSGPADVIAEVQYYEQSGGSGGLYLGLVDRAEYRAFTLDDPFRMVVDLRLP